jgi:hypothetical protein
MGLLKGRKTFPAMRYKVRRQGENLGEFTLDELRSRREIGEFSGGEYVQMEGSLDWQPLDLVIRQGYHTSLPALPPMASKRLPSQTIILGSILAGMALLIISGAVFVVMVTRAQREAINFNSGPHPTRSSEPAVTASQRPVVWATNTLTVTDVNRRVRKFVIRQWLDGYEQRGQRNPECDAEAALFLETWIARNYGGDAATNSISLEQESDKRAGDANCTDPLVLTVAGANNVNHFQAIHCFQRALAAYAGSRHRAYPQLYASLMLATQLNKDPDQVAALQESGLQMLSKCFSDGSFTPDDQQEIAEIFVNGWGQRFFENNATAVCSIIHMAGTNYQWLALSLAGESEIEEAWAARGSGYANTVTDQGWHSFSSHLAQARTELTSAWNLQPAWPLAPERMITVSLGGSDINEMRTWFDRTTTAQIDYNRAWSDFRWGLRPRWYGNQESLLAIGAAAVNTSRFDTDVPRKYIDAIYDAESEMDLPAGAHIFGRPDIWPNVQRMYEGYIAAPAQAENRDGWRTSYAVVAYFAGQFDEARAQLAALNWKPVPQSLTGWEVNLSQMPLEVAARTGKLGLKVSAAEFLTHYGSTDEAIKKYTELAGANPDPLTKQFVQLRLSQLGIAKQLRDGKWVDWLPADSNDPNWVFSFGQARRLPDGALEVESGANGHMLFSQVHVGENFEVRGQFENVRSSNKNFQGGLVMGVPDFNGDNWYGFRIKRHDEEGDVVSFSKGWTLNQLAQPSALNDGTNNFDFIFQNGRVTASVNGAKIFQGVTPPEEIRVPAHSYLVGLGAFSDSADSVIRYRNVQLRWLN